MAATLYSFATGKPVPPLESILEAYGYLADRAETLYREKGERVWTAADVQLRTLTILWAKLNSGLHVPALQSDEQWESLRQRFFNIAGRRFTPYRQPNAREVAAEELKLPEVVRRAIAA